MDFEVFDMDDGKAPMKQSFIAGTEGFMEEPPKRFLIKHKDFKTTSLSEDSIDEVLKVICSEPSSGRVPHWTRLFWALFAEPSLPETAKAVRTLRGVISSPVKNTEDPEGSS